MGRVKFHSVDPEDMKLLVDGAGPICDRSKQNEPWEIVASIEEPRNQKIYDKPSLPRKCIEGKQPYEILIGVLERAANARIGEGCKAGPPYPRFTIGCGHIWNGEVAQYIPGKRPCPVCSDRQLPISTACLCCNATNIDDIQWKMALTPEEEEKRQKRAEAKARKEAREAEIKAKKEEEAKVRKEAEIKARKEAKRQLRERIKAAKFGKKRGSKDI